MTTTYDEPTDLRARIAEQQAELDRQQRDWDRSAEPIRDRLCRALDAHDATGHPSYLKDANVARRDLANLGPRPVESLRLSGLRARLWRAERSGDPDLALDHDYALDVSRNLAAAGWSLRRSEPPTADEEIDYRDLAGYASLAFFEERAVTQALRADPRRSICGVVSNSGPNGEPLACAYPPSPEDDPMHEHSWATLPTFAATPAVDEALVDEITRFREALRVSFAGSEWQRMEQAAASAALLGLTLHDGEHWDAPGSCRDDEQDCPACGGAGYDTSRASDDVWRYPACATCGGSGLAGSDQ